MELGIFLAGHWLDHSVSPQKFYDQLIEQAVTADRLGFDTVWLTEHFMIDYIAIPDPMQIAAIIFERTKRIKVGVAVFIAPNHHPLKLAAQIAQLDVISQGRFVAVIGRGASGYELRQFELMRPEEESRALYREHIEIMVKAWKSRKSMAYPGKFFNFDNATLVPPPYSSEPPLWLAALSEGSVRGGVQNCRDIGLPVSLINSPFREPFSYLEQIYGAFEGALASHGIARADARFAVNRVAYVGESDEEVVNILPVVRNLHRGLVSMLADTERVIDGAVRLSPVPNEPTDEQMLTNTLIGTPDVVREKLQKYIELGVDHTSLYMHMGQAHEQVIRSMTLFAEKVLPNLQFKQRHHHAAARA
jgi:alkanesulfonate monooxygenase SsuD/methylene tetrahydromethanopterin reductase-like flavin-dependent oxidoreductase (luciferase family)